MKKNDCMWIAGLLSLATFIWLRDRTWLKSFDEALPLLLAPILFLWLSEPWRGWRSNQNRINIRLFCGSIVIFLLGLALNLTSLLAISWTTFCWCWLQKKIATDKIFATRRLLIIALFAFPWITLDMPSLGWWFRLTAAWSTENLFHLFGFAVNRAGTQIIIQNLTLDVTAACAGLNVLQSALVAGSVLAFALLGRSVWYWPAIGMLPLVAWLANAVRIVTLAFVALTFGPDSAKGWFHEWGGWLVLTVMFSICGLLFSRMRQYEVLRKKA